MPFVHGTNSVLFLWDSGGTCRNVSGDLNNIALSWTRDNPDTTTFGKTTVQRIGGLQDATLTGAGLFNTAETTSINAILEALMAASATNTLVNWVPGACLSGCPMYSACMLLSAFDVTAPVNGPAAISYTFQIASGSVTSGSVT